MTGQPAEVKFEDVDEEFLEESASEEVELLSTEDKILLRVKEMQEDTRQIRRNHEALASIIIVVLAGFGTGIALGKLLKYFEVGGWV